MSHKLVSVAGELAAPQLYNYTYYKGECLVEGCYRFVIKQPWYIGKKPLGNQQSDLNNTVQPMIKDPLREKDNLPTKDTLLDPFSIVVVHFKPLRRGQPLN